MKTKTKPHIAIAHLLSWCLLVTSLGPVAYAQQNGEGAQTIDESYDLDKANELRAENQAQAIKAEENGGHATSCDAGAKYSETFDSYETSRESYKLFTDKNTDAIKDRINKLKDQNSDLVGAQKDYLIKTGGFLDPSKPIEDRYDAKEKRYRDAEKALEDAKQDEVMALAAKNAAEAKCDDDKGYYSCTPKRRAERDAARARYAQAKQAVVAAQAEYNAARSAYRSSPKDVANNNQAAQDDIRGNANELIASHAISGCGGSGDISINTSSECTLSGPLVEADNKLTYIANKSIEGAKDMAAQRADALFNMELEQKYAADYELYEMAVNGGFTEDHAQKNINSLDQIDAMSDNNRLKTKNLKLTISNIKTVALASSAVKDVVCEQHKMSEADSKATYIFKAAAATWLMAVVNDTDFYSEESDCRITEEITNDRKNVQIESIEKAANVSDQMLENICLRVRPPAAPPEGYDWRDYGDTKEDAEYFVKILTGYTTPAGIEYPPLRERCDEYLVKLRGEEFRDKPRTREMAIEMIAEAEALAMEELMAKNEKLMIADANVKKGEKWLADVNKRLKMAYALYAVVMAAWANAMGICAGCGPHCGFCCGMCGTAAKLATSAAVIMGTLIIAQLLNEKKRAKSFLKQWKKKFHHAKYFTHLACNFETAHEEENVMKELGKEAKKRKQNEIEKAKRDAIRGVNEDINESVLLSSNEKKTSYLENLMDMLIKPVYAAGDEVTGTFKDEDKPKNADDATRNQKRNVKSNTNALNIAEGTESFRFFLVQRNLNFQNQSNDITNQPEHSRKDPAIANAGVRKNVKGGIIRSVDELAEKHLSGKVLEALDGLKAKEKTGFPTPESRLITIQNAKLLFMENINLLHGGIPEVAFQRDQIVDLLTETRRRLDLNDAGLGDTTLIPNGGPKPVCVVGAVEDLNFDPKCGCREKDSCASFEYPQFTPTTPNALKTQGLLSTTAANSLMSGNLSGAAVNGGKLASNAAAVRDDLLEIRGKLETSSGQNGNRGRKTGGSNDLLKDARDLANATESRTDDSLNNLGVDGRNSLLGRVRSALLNEDGKDLASLAKDANNSDSDSRSSRFARRGASQKGDGKDKGKDDISSEVFSLTGGESNLDLEGLTDEEKRRLGLLGNGDQLGSTGANNGHIRRLSDSQGGSAGGVDKNDPFYGINKNRNNSLFKIISRRYKKTAFPRLLR